MIKSLTKIIQSAFLAGVLGLGGISAAHAGQYVGGDLNLDVDDTGDVRFLAANVDGQVRAGGDVSGIAADISLILSVDGNVELIGADIEIGGETAGDVAVAGADITIDMIIAQGLDAAGADLVLLQRVDGEANMAGAQVRISDDASIGGKAMLAARDLHLDGTLEGGGEIRAHEVYINGTIRGAIEIHAETVVFGDEAVVEGPIEIFAPNEPDTGNASVSDLTFIETEWDEDSIEDLIDADIDFDLDFFPSAVVGGVFAASAFLLGLIVVLLAPRSAANIARRFHQRPFVSGFLGLVVLAVLPILVLTLFVLLLITVIGIPLAFLLLFAYPIIMFLAFAFGGMVIGDMALNRSGEDAGLGLRIGSFFAAFVLIAVLGAVPVLGFIVGPLVLCIGLGAWTLALFQRDNANAAATGDAI